MTYYISTSLEGDFSDVMVRVKSVLQDEGFGILSEIDVSQTFRKKLHIEYRPNVILGACNPELAHNAISHDDEIGVLLPCNVIVQKKGEVIEFAAIDPVVSLGSTGDPALIETANEVKPKLQNVIDSLKNKPDLSPIQVH